jgi:AcrR family transcriptional regulator
MSRQQSKTNPVNAGASRRGGRPDRQAPEELVRHILETAAGLFIKKGYAGASMDQIAAAAGAGRQTIYRRFGSKDALFLAVIDQQVQRLAEAARFEEARGASAIDALKETCRFLLDFLLHPDMIRLHRVFAAEADRFPNIGQYIENCMAPFMAVMQRLLWAASVSGRLRKINPELLVTHMNGAITGWPVRQAMLGLNPLAEPGEREAYFETAWDLFLKGAG